MGEAFEHVSDEMGELIESFYPHAAVGSTQTVGLTQYLFWMLIACAALLAVLLVYKAKREKQGLVGRGLFVNAIEYLLDFIKNDICIANLGDSWKRHFPFLATVFFSVLFGNYIGMLPTLKPGMGSTGMTGAVASASFVYFIVRGIQAKGGWGYIKSLAPAGLMPPIAALVWVIEVFSTFLRLVTLAVRLFCNMFAGHVVMGTFALMCTIFVQPLLQGFSAAALGTASMSILWMALLTIIYTVELLIAFLQAYIFTLLSAVYVQLAEAAGH